jgi:hypothetical protein
MDDYLGGISERNFDVGEFSEAARHEITEGTRLRALVRFFKAAD